MNTCLNCNQSTNNPKFCSTSCAAKFNNTHSPKRKPEGKCKICKLPISKRLTYCKSCYTVHCTAKDMTLQEAIYEKHHKSSAFALVRARARSTKKYKEAKCCSNCGYDKHFEACHIKPISKYSPNTKLSKINSEDNILILCPNCHWEYDHGLLKLK